MKSVADVNQQAWHRAAVVDVYRDEIDLQIPEQRILERFGREIVDRPILDLGVGGGRTTPHLLKLSGNYVGVDYSAEMIDFARKKFPSVEFQKGDARDLAAFPDGHFALVFFSFNGLDYMSHSDRLKVLGEVRRVLSFGGLFVFSSHDLANVGYLNPYAFDRIHFSWNPARLGVRLGRYFLGVTRHWLLHRYETGTEEYAVRNDSEGNFGLLTYHIRMDAQFRQLRGAGFEDVHAWNLDGQELSETGSDDSPWIYYVGRKKE